MLIESKSITQSLTKMTFWNYPNVFLVLSKNNLQHKKTTSTLTNKITPLVPEGSLAGFHPWAPRTWEPWITNHPRHLRLKRTWPRSVWSVHPFCSGKERFLRWYSHMSHIIYIYSTLIFQFPKYLEPRVDHYLIYWQLGGWFQIYRELEDQGIYHLLN